MRLLGVQLQCLLNCQSSQTQQVSAILCCTFDVGANVAMDPSGHEEDNPHGQGKRNILASGQMNTMFSIIQDQGLFPGQRTASAFWLVSRD